MTRDPAILVINAGSSSVKFAIFANTQARPRLWSGAIGRIGLANAEFQAKDAAGTLIVDEKRPIDDHAQALRLLLERFVEHPTGVALAAVGHRVVHGGPDCDCPVPVDGALQARLRRLIPLAPLHLPHNLAGISAMQALRPQIPQIACFDTAFHHDLPRIARLTGLPRALTDQGIRRYGFHGLSYEFVMGELERRHGGEATKQRIIIAHLGNGASMAAVSGGVSIDTTMGFSTLGGLLMGTRPGDLDPGLVLHLLLEKGMTAQRVRHLLYEESGLLGVSGLSRDMADLLSQPQSGAAVEAVELFCIQAAKHLAALTTSLGGLDRLVFTGGIGANAPQIRTGICKNLEFIGIVLDPDRNNDGEPKISARRSRVIVEAFATDEEAVIAGHVRHSLAAQQPVAREA